MASVMFLKKLWFFALMFSFCPSVFAMESTLFEHGSEQIEQLIKVRAQDRQQKGCAICKRQSGNICIYWTTHDSSAVHEECFNLIKDIDALFMKKVRADFKDPYDQKEVHREVIDFVEQAISVQDPSCKSIKGYLDKYGMESFIKLFVDQCPKGITNFYCKHPEKFSENLIN